MMNAGPETIVIVPYKPGPESELGPVVNSSYFGKVPADRLKVTPEAVLFRADGKYPLEDRHAAAARPQRARLDRLRRRRADAGQFTMPEDPTKCTT